ncbi:hypothetical protein ACFWP0_23130 [Achromobacter sp. NPDC058515]|uniref:hypothetical protein n=1 Tax=Achromobacter sp. NPDC058515 TaxID=3346533 RepID=UPI00365121A4
MRFAMHGCVRSSRESARLQARPAAPSALIPDFMPVQDTSSRSSPHLGSRRFSPQGILNLELLRDAREAWPHVAGLLLRAYLAFQFIALEFNSPAGWPSAADIFQQQQQGVFASVLSTLATGLLTIMNLVFSIFLLLAVAPELASVVLFAAHCAALFLCPWLWNLSNIGTLQERLFWSSYLLLLIACGPGKITLPVFLGRLKGRSAAH